MIRRVALIAMIVAGAGGAALATSIHREHHALVTAELDSSASLGQMATTAMELGAAQQAYVSIGQPVEPWSARTSDLIQRLIQGSAALRPRLRSAEAPGLLQTFTGALDSLVVIDERIRGNLAIGQDLSASYLIFTEGRDTVALLVATARAISTSERARADTERAALVRRGWIALSAVSIIWAIGLMILVRTSSPAPQAASTSEPAPRDQSTDATAPIESLNGPALPQLTQDVDLDAAAAVCLDLSRLTMADALPDLLARMAVVLDASGIILWIARGDALYAVTAHGYDRKVLARLGPIQRHANNATAAGWRSGRMTVVPTDSMANGALVAPMWNADGCIGVLAAEVRGGRESSSAAAAVATMFAAQLATLVAVMPQPSEAGAIGPAAAEPPFAASI